MVASISMSPDSEGGLGLLSISISPDSVGGLDTWVPASRYSPLGASPPEAYGTQGLPIEVRLSFSHPPAALIGCVADLLSMFILPDSEGRLNTWLPASRYLSLGASPTDADDTHALPIELWLSSSHLSAALIACVALTPEGLPVPDTCCVNHGLPRAGSPKPGIPNAGGGRGRGGRIGDLNV